MGILSPEEVSIMAEEGAKIFGAQEVKMTGLEVAIEAGAEAKVFAIGEATFEAGGYADVRAGREVGISALHGPVDIKGRTIEIGNHVRNLNQDRTTEITASAAEMIELHAEKIEIGAKEKPKAARLRLGDDVGVLAASAGGSEVRVKGDQTFIDGRKVNIG